MKYLVLFLFSTLTFAQNFDFLCEINESDDRVQQYLSDFREKQSVNALPYFSQYNMEAKDALYIALSYSLGELRPSCLSENEDDKRIWKKINLSRVSAHGKRVYDLEFGDSRTQFLKYTQLKISEYQLQYRKEELGLLSFAENFKSYQKLDRTKSDIRMSIEYIDHYTKIFGHKLDSSMADSYLSYELIALLEQGLATFLVNTGRAVAKEMQARQLNGLDIEADEIILRVFDALDFELEQTIRPLIVNLAAKFRNQSTNEYFIASRVLEDFGKTYLRIFAKDKKQVERYLVSMQFAFDLEKKRDEAGLTSLRQSWIKAKSFLDTYSVSEKQQEIIKHKVIKALYTKHNLSQLDIYAESKATQPYKDAVAFTNQYYSDRAYFVGDVKQFRVDQRKLLDAYTTEVYYRVSQITAMMQFAADADISQFLKDQLDKELLDEMFYPIKASDGLKDIRVNPFERRDKQVESFMRQFYIFIQAASQKQVSEVEKFVRNLEFETERRKESLIVLRIPSGFFSDLWEGVKCGFGIFCDGDGGGMLSFGQALVGVISPIQRLAYKTVVKVANETASIIPLPSIKIGNTELSLENIVETATEFTTEEIVDRFDEIQQNFAEGKFSAVVDNVAVVISPIATIAAAPVAILAGDINLAKDPLQAYEAFWEKTEHALEHNYKELVDESEKAAKKVGKFTEEALVDTWEEAGRIIGDGFDILEDVGDEVNDAAQKGIKLARATVDVMSLNLTQEIDELDYLADKAERVASIAAEYAIHSTNPEKFIKTDIHKKAFDGYKDVVREVTLDIWENHKELFGEINEHVLRKISNDLGDFVDKSIELNDDFISVADSVTTFENVARTALVYVGSVAGGPAGAALANVLADMYIDKKKMNEGDILKSLAIGYAAGQAGEYVRGFADNPAMQNFIQRTVRENTQDAMNSVVFEDSYNSRDFIESVLTSAVTVGIGSTDIDPTIGAPAMNAATNSIIAQVVAGKDLDEINFAEVYHSAMQAAAQAGLQAGIEAGLEDFALDLKQEVDDLGNELSYQAKLAIATSEKERVELKIDKLIKEGRYEEARQVLQGYMTSIVEEQAALMVENAELLKKYGISRDIAAAPLLILAIPLLVKGTDIAITAYDIASFGEGFSDHESEIQNLLLHIKNNGLDNLSDFNLSPQFKEFLKGKGYDAAGAFAGVLVGGIVIKSASKYAGKIINSARELGFKTVMGTKVYAKLYKPLETLPGRLKAKRILEGADSTKIAVVGRKMPGVVDPAAAHFRKNGVKVETFSDEIAWDKFQAHQLRYNRSKGLPDKTFLPHNEVVKTDMYKSNKRWAQKLKDEGYTVIDMGNPQDITEMSAFYSIEKKILFGE